MTSLESLRETVEALDRLQEAEASHRRKRQQFGERDMKTIRAWDGLCNAGDHGRDILANARKVLEGSGS